MKNRPTNKVTVGRLGVVFGICFAMILTSAVTSVGTPLTRNNQTIDQLSYSFAFKEPTLQLTSIQDSLYTKIQMPGCIGLGKQAGDPTMPVKFIQLLLPPMTTVDTIEISGTPIQLNLQGIDLTVQHVYPYQNEVPIGIDVPQEFLINDELYASTQLYPTENHGEYHIGYSHGYAILDLSLTPMQFIPSTGQIFYYPEMTVTINLKENGYKNPLFSNNPDDEAWVTALVYNPEVTQYYLDMETSEYPGGLCDPSGQYDYVIITTTASDLDYWDTSESTPYNWDSLISHHGADGLACTVVTIQDINACSDYQGPNPFNDAQAHIREFCKDAYEDWGTRYVLIAGDADKIAARQLYYSYEGNVDSDVYWSNLDLNFNADSDSQWGEEGDSGFDLYAEIFIGRITCDVPQDVSNWLTKNFFYADSVDFEYLDNAAFYGGDSTWSCQGDDFVDYGAVKTTTNYLGPSPESHGEYPAWLGMQYGFETWNAVNPGNSYNMSVMWSDAPSPNPGWNGNNPVGGLRDDINNDQVTLLSGFAHANPDYSCDVTTSEWESQYTNTKPFFVTDMGCHCGDFDDVDDGVLDAMLFHSDTELAFACTYNTGYGWGSFEDTNASSAIQMKCFWDYFFDVENNSQSESEWQFGKGQAWSKDTMAPMIDWTYSSAPGSYRGVIECCLYFGDPALTMKSPSPSDPPAQPSKPLGKTLIVWNREYSYTSVTTDPNGDQISYMFDWGDGSNSGWIGPFPSGQTGTGSHSWTELGTYSVRVKARDTWGAGSPMSETLTVVVTDNTPPFDPTITGPGQIKPKVAQTYTVNAVDEFDHDVTFDIDWGDGNGVAGLGPYQSGETVELTHTWAKKGAYKVKVMATDQFGMESNWTYLDITCPTEYRFSLNTFLQHLFEMFPHAFPILRQLMGY